MLIHSRAGFVMLFGSLFPCVVLQDDPTSVITGRTLRELTELKEDVAAFIVSC